MVVKTITIKKKVYDDLTRIKRDSESFSDLFERLAEKEQPDLARFAGILSKKSAEELEKSVKKSREKSRKKMQRIAGEMK